MNKLKYKELTSEVFYEGLKSLVGCDIKAKSLLNVLIDHQQKEVVSELKLRNEAVSGRDLALKRLRRLHMRKLKKNMTSAGCPQPKKYMEAHHVVAWWDDRALAARQILAQYDIDIDDESNGVWLHKSDFDDRNDDYIDSLSHSKVHTNVYYVNLTNLLQTEALVSGTTADDIRDVLRDIGEDLISGNFKI